jgi:hypothetical protein
VIQLLSQLEFKQSHPKCSPSVRVGTAQRISDSHTAEITYLALDFFRSQLVIHYGSLCETNAVALSKAAYT